MQVPVCVFRPRQQLKAIARAEPAVELSGRACREARHLCEPFVQHQLNAELVNRHERQPFNALIMASK